MPRVLIKAKEYKVSDFSMWLEKQRLLHKMKNYEMAAVIDTTPQNYYRKYKAGSWSYDDVLSYIHFFKLDDKEILKLMKY